MDGVQTIITKVKDGIAKGFILNSDLTQSPCYIVKQNNLFAHGETIKDALDALQEKLFEDLSEDERIEMFWQEFQSDKKYSAALFYEWHHKLTGSCEMGRNSFVRDHSIDLDKDTMTVQEFVDLTKNSYGGDTILKLLEHIPS